MARRMILYVDGTSRRLVQSPFSKQDGQVEDFITGENITVDIVPLREIEDGSNPSFEPDDSYASDTWKVGVGLVDTNPTEGTYKLTYGASTSAAIEWDATASELGAAINAMADVISAGLVTTSGTNEEGYRIRWVTSGAKTDFGSDEINLLPESTLGVALEREGATNITEVVQLRLIQKQAGLTTSASTIPAGSMSATELVAGAKSSREIFDVTCVANTAPVAQVEELTCVAVGGVYQIATITCGADTADSTNQKYFSLFDDEGSVGFWIDTTTISSTIPAAAAALDRSVEITSIVAGDSDGVMANKIAAAITADSKFTATHDGNVVTVTYSTIGAHGAAADGDTGWTFANPTTGASTDAYSGKYFYGYVGGVVKGFWFSQTTGLTDPPTAALALTSDLTEIIYSTTGTAQAMATSITAKITAVTGLTAVASGTEIHITHGTAGDVSDFAVGDSPLTDFTVVTNGSDSSLDGTHFITYETDGIGGEVSRAWWFNPSGTASPAGTALTADESTEITTVSDGDKAHEVTALLATAMDAVDGYDAVAHGTKVKVTSSVGYNFSTATAETSGFTVTAVQAGGTGTDANKVVEISFSDQAIGGIYTMGIDTGNGSVESGGIPWNTAPVELVEILGEMTNVSKSDIKVEGGYGGDLRITFQGLLAATVVTVTVDDSAITWISGLRFTLDLNTTSAYSLLYGLDDLECVFEAEATQGSTYTVKLIHAPCTLKNGLIDSSALSPSPLVSYYTSAEVDGLVIHHLKTITSLTGGTSADLDSIVTASTITPERGVFFWNADTSEYVFYVLRSGTSAESSPGTIRPDDYAASTNEVYWDLVELGDTAPTDYIHYDTAHTGLTGGTAADLDVVVTTSLAAGYSYKVIGTDEIERTYELVAGTDAEVSPWVVRPDDYAGTTNEKVWVQRFGTQPLHVTGVSSLIGGTSADLDYIPTVHLPAGTTVQFPTPDGCQLVYELTAQATPSAVNWTSIDHTAETLTLVGHNLIDGQRIKLSAATTIATGLSESVLYYVVSATATTIQVALTRGGAAVTFSDNGTGTHSLHFYETPFDIYPTDYTASTNEFCWKLIAPWTSTTFEAVAPATDHATQEYDIFHTPHWWKMKEVQLDVVSLPSGSGSTFLDWKINWNSVLDLVDGTISHDALAWRAITDEAVGFNTTVIPQGQAIKWEVTDTGHGSGTKGKGAVLHFSHLYCPLDE